MITRGDSSGQHNTELKTLEIDFRGPFQKFDVMQDIGVDPMLLGKTEELRKILIEKVGQIPDRSLRP